MTKDTERALHDVYERFAWLRRKDMHGAGGEAVALLVLASYNVKLPAPCAHTRYTESPNANIRQCRDCYTSWATAEGPPP